MVHLAREREALLIGQAIGIEKHGERVATESLRGKDVPDFATHLALNGLEAALTQVLREIIALIRSFDQTRGEYSYTGLGSGFGEVQREDAA